MIRNINKASYCGILMTKLSKSGQYTLNNKNDKMCPLKKQSRTSFSKYYHLCLSLSLARSLWLFYRLFQQFQ